METPAKPLSVLLIEDDEITNFLSSSVLKNMNIDQVSAVLHGKLACDHLLNHCPDLIFLDITMPVMDGFEFLEQIKKKRFCPNTRIAMLTSSSRLTDREKAFTFSNVIDYVEKPLDIQKAERVLAKL